MEQQFFEYAVRIHPVSGRERIAEYGQDFASAAACLRHEAAQHGDDRVHLLTRQAFHTEWRTSPTIPPVPPDPDGGICDPMVAPAKPVVDVTVGEALQGPPMPERSLST